MNSAVISRVNKIRLPELQPYLFKFYHFKKTVGYKYNNIKVVEEAPGIKVTDKDTKEIYDNDAYNRKMRTPKTIIILHVKTWMKRRIKTIRNMGKNTMETMTLMNTTTPTLISIHNKVITMMHHRNMAWTTFSTHPKLYIKFKDDLISH